jgi:2-iminobutanoate/2-iminopropanoate deaminase
MRELVERGGASLANVGRVVCYVTRPDDREPVYEAWEQLFPDATQRPAFKVLTGPLPGGQLVRLDVLAVAGATPRRIDSEGAPGFHELFLDEPSNQADGFRLGSLVFATSLTSKQPGASTEAQIRDALQRMDALLRLAGSNRDEVARVSFYMRDLAERPTLNAVWQEWYPDPENRPPHTYLPAALPEGQDVALQVIALAGARRRVLKVDGVEHGDPMSLGAITGNLLTSSRIFGAGGRETPEGLEPHTERCFANASALLANAGLTWRHLSQLVVYGSYPKFRDSVAAALEAKSQGASADIQVDFLDTDLGRGTLLPRLQLLGLTKSEAAL